MLCCWVSSSSHVEGRHCLQNIGNYSSSDMTSHHRRLWSSDFGLYYFLEDVTQIYFGTLFTTSHVCPSYYRLPHIFLHHSVTSFVNCFLILRENQALPVISIIRVMLSGYSGYAVLHHAVCSIFNYLFSLSKNTVNSELFVWPHHIPYTAHSNWGVTHSHQGCDTHSPGVWLTQPRMWLTHTKSVTYRWGYYL